MAINLAFHDISRVIWWRIYRENGDLSRVISWSLDGDLLSLFDPWNWELGFFTLVHSYYVVGSPFKTLSQRPSLQQLTMVNHRKTIYSWFMIAKLVQITTIPGVYKATYISGGPTWYGDLNGISSNMKISTTKVKREVHLHLWLVYYFFGIYIQWDFQDPKLEVPTITYHI
jgi:hypothetical protein